MPLGAFRLNSLGKVVAVEEAAVDSVTSFSGVVYNTEQYYTYQTQFAGEDSSGRPVFAWGYKDDTDSDAKAVLIRINTDNSVTTGTVSTAYNGTVTEACNIITDQGESEYAVVAYEHDSKTYARAVEMDLDNLTFGTWGSEVEVYNQATFATGTYLGDRTYGIGPRYATGGGVGLRVTRVTRSGTTLTVGNTVTTYTSGNVYQSVHGFNVSGDFDRFVAISSTGSVNVSAGYFNAGSASTASNESSVITGLSSVIETQGAVVDADDKLMVISRGNDGTTKAAVTQVSWPTSGTAAPTHTNGTQLTLTDDPDSRDWFVSRGRPNETYLKYYDGTDWKLRKLTVSGTTITEGSATTLDTLTSSQTSFGDMSFANVTNGQYLLSIIDNSGSNNPDIYARYLGDRVRSAVTLSAVNNAQVDTAQSKFGGASALFDGTGDHITVGDLEHNAYKDITIEGWVRFNSINSVWNMFAAQSTTNYVGLRNFSGTHALGAAYTGHSGTYYLNMTLPSAASTGVWYHWAITKSGTTIKHFWNGTELTTTYNSAGSMSQDKGFANLARIGDWTGSAGYELDGHLDEFRISNKARYTTGFTPSTTEFTNDANTVLLTHMNGSDGSTTFTDDNS